MNMMKSAMVSRLLSVCCSRVSMLTCQHQSCLRMNSRVYPILSFSQTRHCSAVAYQYFNVNRDVKSGELGVVVIEMNKPPINSMNVEFMTEFISVLDALEKDNTCRGIVITSVLPSVFCAGLDIQEMYQPEPGRIRDFWRAFQELSMRLYGSSKAVVSAINGSAPAAGCALSLFCDYRVMAEGNYKIGLTASLLGIIAPPWLQRVTQNVVGTRQADMLLQLGTLFTVQQALNIGLVDRTVPRDRVLEEAVQQMDVWLRVPDAGRKFNKRIIRSPLIEKLQHNKQEDEEFFVELVHKEEIQKSISSYLQSLKNRHK